MRSILTKATLNLSASVCIASRRGQAERGRVRIVRIQRSRVNLRLSRQIPKKEAFLLVDNHYLALLYPTFSEISVIKAPKMLFTRPLTCLARKGVERECNVAWSRFTCVRRGRIDRGQCTTRPELIGAQPPLALRPPSRSVAYHLPAVSMLVSISAYHFAYSFVFSSLTPAAKCEVALPNIPLPANRQV